MLELDKIGALYFKMSFRVLIINLQLIALSRDSYTHDRSTFARADWMSSIRIYVILYAKEPNLQLDILGHRRTMDAHSRKGTCQKSHINAFNLARH